MAESQRTDGPQGPGEPGPDGASTERVYAVVFGRVWLAALGAAAAMARWTVTASDPVAGEILVEARGFLRGKARPARVRIRLDDVGLTRVEATFLDDPGNPTGAAQPRQIARFHRHLERLLRRDSAP